MKKFIKAITFFAVFALLLSSCKKDDPVITNEEELITTVKYVLTPESGGTAIELVFRDLDGDGGNASEVVGGTLMANTVYNGELELLNESEDPAEDITAEIREEDLEHQFFFKSTIDGLSFTYEDADDDGNPVGLQSKITTTDAATGNITVTLRHEPMKSETGVSSGDISNAGGETDIEVTFPIDVQ